MDLDRRIERYTDQNRKPWIRIKYMDVVRTEVIMTESEYMKRSENRD